MERERERENSAPTGRLERGIISLLVRVFFLGGLLEPSEEGLGGLPNLLRGGNVDVLLAGLAAPLESDLFAEEVVVVVELQDLDDLVEDVRVILDEVADETLSAAEEGLFMTLRGDELQERCLVSLVKSDREGVGRGAESRERGEGERLGGAAFALTCFIMPARLGT